MNVVFADTSFFVAFYSSRDVNHSTAIDFVARYPNRYVTTEWIVLELANFWARHPRRRTFAAFVADLRQNASFEIVSANAADLVKGLQLYDARPDKQWSLTDCISFVVMKEQSITHALTADHHFEQAGFTILLK